jgi:hypothetical protein
LVLVAVKSRQFYLRWRFQHEFDALIEKSRKKGMVVGLPLKGFWDGKKDDMPRA